MKDLTEMIDEVEYTLDIELTETEAEELSFAFDNDTDFYITLDGKEYRFISENTIDDTYHDEQMDLIKECYLDGKDLPWWFEIDWDKTIENVLNADGYGNHFAGYDGSEETLTYESELWYVFRTN